MNTWEKEFFESIEKSSKRKWGKQEFSNLVDSLEGAAEEYEAMDCSGIIRGLDDFAENLELTEKIPILKHQAV